MKKLDYNLEMDTGLNLGQIHTNPKIYPDENNLTLKCPRASFGKKDQLTGNFIKWLIKKIMRICGNGGGHSICSYFENK